MESVDQLQRALDSLAELRTVVKTMKALSAASIRQYEQAVEALRGYAQTVERGLQVVLRDTPPTSGPTRSGRRPQHIAAIVFGSDHGLCGRFNEEIAEHAGSWLQSITAERRVLAVGARVAASLERRGQPIEEAFLVPGSAAQITASVQQILLKVDDWQRSAGVELVQVFYHRHDGGSGHRPVAERLLPVDLQKVQALRDAPWPSRSLPTYSMDRDRLLSRLIYQQLFVAISRACAESQASEHASRLAAMQAAQRNLDTRLEDVTQAFRRARQGVITAELLDVVAGFEAITAGRD